MEFLLVIVAAVSLALAAIMSTVAWRLLRDSKVRTTNRAEALIALLNLTEKPAQRPAAEPPSAASGVVSHAARSVPGPPDLPDGPAPAVRDPRPATEPKRTTESRPAVESRPATESRLPAAARPASERLPLTESRAAVAVMDAPLHDEPIPDEIEIEAEPSWDRKDVKDRGNSGIAAMFKSDEPRQMSLGRWLALGAAGLVILIGAGTVYALNSGPWLSSVTGSADREDTTAASTRQPLELLSLKHSTDDTGAFVVTGLVQNPAEGATLRGVVATVYLFDQQGRYFASGRGKLEVATLGAGEESPFVVRIPQAAAVGRYRVGFRLDDGGVVAHVDRRGQTPTGTSGDTIDGEVSPSVVTPAGTPRRSEG